MSIGAIGAMLFVLVILFIFSRIWFYFVDGIFEFIKGIFRRNKQQTTWHEFPQEKEEVQ